MQYRPKPHQSNNFVLAVAQMSRPCQSSASPTASTAAWASPLQPWGAGRGPTTTAPSRWSTASCPRRTSSTTSAPTAPTACRSRRAPCRRCPDTSPSSQAWSTPTRPSPSWARAAGRGSTPPPGAPWGPPTAPARTCRRAAAGGTRTFPPARPPGWTRWTMDSFDLDRWENMESAEWDGHLRKGLVRSSWIPMADVRTAAIRHDLEVTKKEEKKVTR